MKYAGKNSLKAFLYNTAEFKVDNNTFVILYKKNQKLWNQFKKKYFCIFAILEI